jgi:hypothetical protein
MTHNKVQNVEYKLNNEKNNLNEKNDIGKEIENGEDDWDRIYDDSGESILKKFEKV